MGMKHLFYIEQTKSYIVDQPSEESLVDSHDQLSMIDYQ